MMNKKYFIFMQGVRPAVPFRSLSKGDDVTWGFLEGVMNLPVDGRWLVHAMPTRAHSHTHSRTHAHTFAHSSSSLGNTPEAA